MFLPRTTARPNSPRPCRLPIFSRWEPLRSRCLRKAPGGGTSCAIPFTISSADHYTFRLSSVHDEQHDAVVQPVKLHADRERREFCEYVGSQLERLAASHYVCQRDATHRRPFRSQISRLARDLSAITVSNGSASSPTPALFDFGAGQRLPAPTITSLSPASATAGAAGVHADCDRQQFLALFGRAVDERQRYNGQPPMSARRNSVAINHGGGYRVCWNGPGHRVHSRAGRERIQRYFVLDCRSDDHVAFGVHDFEQWPRLRTAVRQALPSP